MPTSISQMAGVVQVIASSVELLATCQVSRSAAQRQGAAGVGRVSVCIFWVASPERIVEFLGRHLRYFILCRGPLMNEPHRDLSWATPSRRPLLRMSSAVSSE